MPGDINSRNAITQALMRIRQPPPQRQQQAMPGGGIPNQAANQPQMQPVMSPPPPQMPAMPTGPAPGMQAFQQGQNLMAPPQQGGAIGGRVPLGQVPGQMMNNLQQIPQRLQNLLPGQPPPVDPAIGG